MGDPLFSFEGVTLERSGTTVLDDVSVAVPDDGITVFAGVSGAGKSTLIRCCNRLERPTAGRIVFRGEDLATLDPPAHRRRCGMVFQAPARFPGTVGANLRAVAPDLTDEAAADLLARVGLDRRLLDRQADALSGGEAQRMVLARTLTTEPEVLLADEPTSSLDATATKHLETLARSLADEGMPVLWVTHDLHQLRRLADHLVLLRSGRVTWAGAADDPEAADALAASLADAGEGELVDGGEVVGWLGVVVSVGFVLAAVALTAQQRLRLGRPIVIALGRSLVQMAIVGVALVPIVDPDTPLIWSWVWVVAITVFSAVTVARRAPAVPGLLGVALVGMGTVAATGLSMMFGLGVFALEGRTLVPVAGMIVGNSMKAAIVGATRVAESVADNRSEIEAGLALGMSPRRASLRFVRSALRTAISPQVEQTAALGIVFLPGAMTGLILAGVDPLDAVRTQLALMYVILAEVVVAAMTTGLGTLYRLTTPDQTLIALERSD